MQFNVILEPAQEGGFNVIVPALDGCFTQGETTDEALENAKESIRYYLEGLVLSHQGQLRDSFMTLQAFDTHGLPPGSSFQVVAVIVSFESYYSLLLRGELAFGTAFSGRPDFWARHAIRWIDSLNELSLFSTSEGIFPGFRDYQSQGQRPVPANISGNRGAIEQPGLTSEFDL